MTTQEHEFSLAGVPLTGVDSFGVLWTVEKAGGWHDSPEARSSRTTRVQQHGEFPGKNFRAGRLVTLQGKVYAPDTTALEGAARRLAVVLASGGFGELSGSSAWGTLSAQVQVEDSPRFEPISDRHAVWQVAVSAPDPNLYGSPSFMATDLAAASPGTGWVWPAVFPVDWGVPPGSTPGAIALANAGTVAYWPRLRLGGPVTNPVVSLLETGAWIRYGGTIPAGQWIDVDLAGRKVLLNGEVSKRQFVTSSGDWLAVPPGGGSVSWVADSADPAALLSVWGYEGAWI